MTTMNGNSEINGDMDAVRSKVNGHAEGAQDQDETVEDASRALQLLKTYNSKDGISITDLMDESKTGGLVRIHFTTVHT